MSWLNNLFGKGKLFNQIPDSPRHEASYMTTSRPATRCPGLRPRRSAVLLRNGHVVTGLDELLACNYYYFKLLNISL